MKGFLLVVDGIDGCGKSTQINHLAKWLPTSGLMPNGANLYVTREPGGTKLGNALRQLLLKTSKATAPEPIAELLLYAADRAQHISQIIQPALAKGDWVLSDRFSGSTTAYQGYGRQLDMHIIKRLEKIATQGISPDITLWLDIGVDESLKRRHQQVNDRIESEGKDFLERVSSGFSDLGNSRNWVKISAEKDQQLVSQQIETELKNYFQRLQTSGE
tara:strand:+ start:1278 stop:1928 length:651 start_codon:yes stop_codon:yes gene_type:complete